MVPTLCDLNREALDVHISSLHIKDAPTHHIKIIGFEPNTCIGFVDVSMWIDGPVWNIGFKRDYSKYKKGVTC